MAVTRASAFGPSACGLLTHLPFSSNCQLWYRHSNRPSPNLPSESFANLHEHGIWVIAETWENPWPARNQVCVARKTALFQLRIHELGEAEIWKPMTESVACDCTMRRDESPIGPLKVWNCTGRKRNQDSQARHTQLLLKGELWHVFTPDTDTPEAVPGSFHAVYHRLH